MELLVSIVDELVGLILVILPNLFPVLEGGINVCTATWDSTNVGVSKLFNVVHSLIRVGSVLLELLCGGLIFLLSLLGSLVDT